MQYDISRLKDNGPTKSDKHQLAQAELQLQRVNIELSNLLPQVERLQKTQRSLQSDIRRLKSQISNGGHAQMKGEKSMNADGVTPRERWKQDTGEMWKSNTMTPPGAADHHDDSADDGLSPRDKFMQETREAWREKL